MLENDLKCLKEVRWNGRFWFDFMVDDKEWNRILLDLVFWEFEKEEDWRLEVN